MKGRREFLKMSPALVLPAAVGLAAGGVARADDGSAKEFLGTWDTVHSLPFPPGSFREFLSFADGGVLHETNSFLHTASNLDFSMYGLPNVLNASDGMGNWVRTGNGVVDLVFRKMLFDGAHRNFGDLWVSATAHSDGNRLSVVAHVVVVDPAGRQLADLGPATSQGTRLR